MTGALVALPRSLGVWLPELAAFEASWLRREIVEKKKLEEVSSVGHILASETLPCQTCHCTWLPAP